ncbi:MAG TPA: hypothetical protein EYP56_05670 [Planctomycetaceae bacterium]|nr:hypothetical protein [Planctomycetaceae bacterium]HIQ22700.1 hypothetical protein [Planctomycetota bacterium]
MMVDSPSAAGDAKPPWVERQDPMQASRILPNLWVGSFPRDASDIAQLQQAAGVTAVMNLQTEEDFEYWQIDWERLQESYRTAGVALRHMPVRDFDPDDLRRRLPECVATLAELLQAGHVAYVHCSAGVNRSPSTVIAYLHWVEGWDLDEALRHVRARHSCDPYLEAIQKATEDRREAGS